MHTHGAEKELNERKNDEERIENQSKIIQWYIMTAQNAQDSIKYKHKRWKK